MTITIKLDKDHIPKSPEEMTRVVQIAIRAEYLKRCEAVRRQWQQGMKKPVTTYLTRDKVSGDPMNIDRVPELEKWFIETSLIDGSVSISNGIESYPVWDSEYFIEPVPSEGGGISSEIRPLATTS